ncbi:hypothetical protein [Enterococcus casseliflavus]|uniref:hypothetical protein n=1 Tax=Enterococcus casseliflavus TaxID=37734 RepID=UPI0018847C34|nr:hypothetical protein [Enterococcus casseliflavus]MBE9909325.1 hypothetical protein [Enterococcus casseliflavus]
MILPDRVKDNAELVGTSSNTKLVLKNCIYLNNIEKGYKIIGWVNSEKSEGENNLEVEDFEGNINGGSIGIEAIPSSELGSELNRNKLSWNFEKVWRTTERQNMPVLNNEDPADLEKPIDISLSKRISTSSVTQGNALPCSTILAYSSTGEKIGDTKADKEGMRVSMK